MAHIRKDGKLSYKKVEELVVEAYYIAKCGDREIIDDIISIHTGWMPWNWGTPNVMHVEGGVIADDELWFFSSTSREYLSASGQTNGCRWIKGSDLLRNGDRWIFTSKVSTVTENRKRIVRANSIVGCKYDFVGVVADFISLYDFAVHKKTWYCSKSWHFVDTGKVCRISPRRRYKIATKKLGFRDAFPADILSDTSPLGT